MELNIYKNQNEVEKTYTCRHYDITWGTVNSVLAIFDLENMKEPVTLLKTISKCRTEINKILMEMFPDLKEEELGGVKISELIPLIAEVLGFSFSELTGISGKN